MPRKKLKNAAKELMSFRVTSKEKKELRQLIADCSERMNSKTERDEYKVTDTEIIVSALRKGLGVLKYSELPPRRKKEG